MDLEPKPGSIDPKSTGKNSQRNEGEHCGTLDLTSQNLQELSIQLLTDRHTQTTCLTVLNLDFNDLSHLPSGLSTCLPHLQVLSANGNNLKTLPWDIGSLTSLTEVCLCENELTSLPDSVQHLVNVKCLRLTGNRLPGLPEDFGELAGLEELSVEENMLEKFPPTFALLDRLRVLEASHNQLRALPKFLGSLKSLTHVNVSSNKLESLPDSFSQLKQLIVVDVSDNKLRSLPMACSSQKTLKKFFGGMNQLAEFPFWLGRLAELTDLCLKENNITGDGLPDDFGQVCQKLRYLDMCGNHLTALPESFGQLARLEYCHLGSMLDELERKDHINGNWLTSLPRSFTTLTALTKLRLDENHLQFLPDDFGSLRNLEYFNLGQNMVHDIPESFGELRCLRVCILSRNNIQLLPSSIGQLSSLEELSLDNNLLQELPESFKDLKQLKTLDLFHNKMTQPPSCLSDLTSLQFLDLNQNPLKMAKKLVPSIKKPIQYAPRCTQDPTSIWRGRPRVRTVGFVDLQVTSTTEGEDDGDEMADEPVDEIYGSEDLPYNMRFHRSGDVGSVTSWRSHSGPDVRPLFARHAQRNRPRELLDDSEDESLSSSHTELSDCLEERWDQESNGKADVENSQDPPPPLPEEEESWEESPPVPLPEEESWEDTPAAAYTPVQCAEEDNWDKDLVSHPTIYSHEDVSRPISSPFSYNPQLQGFFLGPYDLHAPPTFRPKVHDPDFKDPDAEQGQFDDDDDDQVQEENDR